jgi:fatty acid/phospholipid biosynthesis enzyme
MGTSAWYAPGAAAAQMVEAIVRDQKRIFPVCALLNGEYGMKNIYLGVPVKLGKNGIEEIIELKLDAEEKKLLDASIYQGFMETDALLRGEIQVAICDGFVGNLLLKAMEGFADIVLGKFKELPAEMYSRIDYGKWGGAVLLGLTHPVYICHGKSKRESIAATIHKAWQEGPKGLAQQLPKLMQKIDKKTRFFTPQNSKP